MRGKKQRRMIRWTMKARGELMRVSHMQASNAVDVIKYFEQIDFATADCIRPLSLHAFSLQEAKK